MWTRRLGMLALCILTTGCQLASNAVHNITFEVKRVTAEVVEHRKLEQLARESWEKLRTTEDHRAHPKEFAEGFKDGFVDYLQFGGSGQPPFVPPKHYWGSYYHTPDGYRAIEDWFAGFRFGAATAQQSGYRKWVTMPSALTTEPPPPPVFSAVPEYLRPAPIQQASFRKGGTLPTAPTTESPPLVCPAAAPYLPPARAYLPPAAAPQSSNRKAETLPLARLFEPQPLVCPEETSYPLVVAPVANKRPVPGGSAARATLGFSTFP